MSSAPVIHFDIVVCTIPIPNLLGKSLVRRDCLARMPKKPSTWLSHLARKAEALSADGRGAACQGASRGAPPARVVHAGDALCSRWSLSVHRTAPICLVSADCWWHVQNLKERPLGKFAVLARLSRAPERSVGVYVSTGAQRKRSQNPKSAGVLTSSRYWA